MRRLHIGGIFGLALVVRLVYIVQWHALPYGNSPLLDALIYDNWAQDIAAGHILRGQAFYQLPLYAYTLGLLYAIFGHSLWLASLFNAFIGAATCSILALLAFDAFGLSAAITTGILAAFYKPMIFYTAPVMKEPLGLFLLALFALFAYRAVATNKAKMFLWSGICLGLCGLVRGNVLALAPIILFFVWRGRPELRIKNGGFFLAGICAVIFPITLHNAIASHDFVLISYEDGFNAYIGNGPSATGRSYTFPRGVDSNPAFEEHDISRIASEARGRPLRPSEISAYWWGQTIDYVLDHPGHELSLVLNKLEAFWSDSETFDNYDMSFIERHFDTLIAWPLASFGIILSLAVFAVIASSHKRREAMLFFIAMVFAYMLTLLPFYVTDRYRLPVIIFLLPLAGAAIPAALELYRKKQSNRLVVAGLAAIVPLALALAPKDMNIYDEAFSWGTLCTIYEDEGYHVAALLALDQALAISAHSVGSDAWIKGADALDHLGNHQKAEDTLREAEKIYTTDGSVVYNIGRMEFIDEDYPAAFVDFKKSIELTPSFALSYRGLAAVYDHYGFHAKAMEAIRHGLDVVPGDPKLMEVVNGFQ